MNFSISHEVAAFTHGFRGTTIHSFCLKLLERSYSCISYEMVNLVRESTDYELNDLVQTA